MDFAGLALVITAIGGLLGILTKFWLDLNQTKRDYDHVWKGIVSRGFLEAQKMRYLIPDVCNETELTVSGKARQVYSEIAPALKSVRRRLAKSYGRSPSDEELGFAIEREFQNWMLGHACPLLGVNQHGCIAIACVLARENGDHIKDVDKPADIN